MWIKNRKIRKIIFLLTTWIIVFLALQTLGYPQKALKSLTLQNADIHSVLSFLAEEGKTNVVASPKVQGTVTLSLKGVSWKQALEIITKTYNLAMVEEPGYIRVLPIKDYIDEMTASTQHEADQQKMVSLHTEVIKVENGTAGDLVKPIKTSLSERGNVDIDQRTNSLIVRDIPENVKRAVELVKSLDKVTEQIKISAQLIEVETGALTEFGVNWEFIPSLEGDIYTNDMGLNQKALDAMLPEDRISNFTYSTLQSDFQLDMAISALVQDNKAKVVAHPEITTIDNKEAYIQMGQKVPIKQFDASGNTIVTFVEVGTILRVTPHITSEGRILMKLVPERS
ncbi:MAG: hypothetical protein OEV55_06360, partial [candidate division Zixibacteria bacterium]|nr:hypothetical protein [candidate division Zixibacteria bacterium]